MNNFTHSESRKSPDQTQGAIVQWPVSVVIANSHWKSSGDFKEGMNGLTYAYYL